MNYIKSMAKLINSMRYQYGVYQVFDNFLELSAIALSNSVDYRYRKKREARYLDIIKTYKDSDINIFPELMDLLVEALEEQPDDYLGRLFMELELFDHWKGQFFTPMSVSRLMAEMLITDHINTLEEKGFITLNEPAVGGGVTIIALNNTLRDRGYNPQQILRIVAQDIDRKAVHMSYIQFSLLGLNAQVLHGDTLAMKFHDVWRTPGYMLGWGKG
ncbi:N-6 DNA methylase [Cytobacillus firmus]|uniref:N-6 DNA methylase n=1 Tax=Cytobacillus firmus TaxID=1399 RepID=UPI0018CFD76B|nr:N-6 DNA methylase [Cytobacillus firmus]MED1938921.1 N-6 DNA methylase [Cytobacillus firmus]